MSDDDGGERTEEATQQRRDDFRKRGQVAQTKELGSVFLLFGSLLSIWLLGRFFLMQFSEIFNRSYSEFFLKAARQGEWVPAGIYALEKIALLVMPLSAVFWFMAFASSVVQTGFMYNEEAFDWDINKLNPLEGFKKIASFRSLVEGAKSLAKLVIIGCIVYVLLKREALRIPHLMNYTIEQIFGYLGSLIGKMIGGVATFMAVLAGADYFFQRWDLEKKMRMTKQEIKEEHKSREGDPMIKSRIRRIQREMAGKRMMKEVPTADVIVTNPTHIAIALKYDETMAAPRVIAKGAGLIADKIRAIAKENGIPLVENKPLARTMYKTIKVGHSIPRELYNAVAEVLSYVYKLRRRGRR